MLENHPGATDAIKAIVAGRDLATLLAMDLLHVDYPVCRRQGADFGAFMGTNAIQFTNFAAAIMTYLSVEPGPCARFGSLSLFRLQGGDKGNQTFLKGQLLQFNWSSANVDHQTVDLQHPHHGVVSESTAQGPFR